MKQAAAFEALITCVVYKIPNLHHHFSKAEVEGAEMRQTESKREEVGRAEGIMVHRRNGELISTTSKYSPTCEHLKIFLR